MADLKADSALCRCIVIAFLDFLNSVEPAPDRDFESIEVAKECLLEAFKIESSSVASESKSESLIEIFSSRKASKQHEVTADHNHKGVARDVPSTSSTHNDSNISIPEASHSLDDEGRRESHTLGTSEDELFGQFFGALEKIQYFGTARDEHDDQVQLDRATNLFHNALADMQKSGFQTFDFNNLAETFKSQGNRAMQSKEYSDAIELYTLAIALCDDNAVYYCNRAAAYTQINKYTEAIQDCYKSIELDPNYSKAYSRLGFAYYAQGNYMDAIRKGFLRALHLDPNNDSVRENIRVAEQKLIEQHRRSAHNQNSSSASHPDHSGAGSRNHASALPFSSMPFNVGNLPSDMANMFINMSTNVQGQHSQGRHEGESESASHPNHVGAGSRNHAPPPAFTSIPLGVSSLPTDIANMFVNMSANVHQGQHSQQRHGGGSEPETSIGRNINVNLGDQMPEEISGALRSMMQMFSGGAPTTDANSQQTPNSNGGAAPN